jgi:hypothetical protein
MMMMIRKAGDIFIEPFSDLDIAMLDDVELERAGDNSQPADVSAPSKAQHHCVND